MNIILVYALSIAIIILALGASISLVIRAAKISQPAQPPLVDLDHEKEVARTLEKHLLDIRTARFGKPMRTPFMGP